MRAEQDRQVEQTHLTHAERVLEQLSARRQRLEEEQRALPRVDPEEAARREQELAEIDAQIADRQAALARATEALPAAQAALEEARQQLQALEQRLTEVEARRAALEQLQRRLENNEKLATWLREHGLDGQARLWQGIEVCAGWEDALEAVLRERLNAVALEALAEASHWSEIGRASCRERVYATV